MDEGRNFPLPVTQSWAWENQVEPARGGPNGAHANGGRAIFVTIVTPDRAAQSRILARSVRECHPDARLAVLAVDPDGTATPRLFEDLYDFVIPMEQLAFDGLADMRFRYSLAELCFALKPWIIRHLLDRFADDPIYYFDSDIEIFTPLAEVEAALAHGANLVLTPHILQPGPNQERERAVLLAGSFNAGFLAIAPSAPARAFVAWWCERLRTGGTHNLLEGTHGDQKWLELAPSICDGVAVLRHPGYNFAYWNAHERPLSCLGGVWSAAGWPLRFVHYSLWNLRDQDSEQYLARYFTTEYQTFSGLFAEYRKKVQDEDSSCVARAHADAGHRSTAFGQPVPEVVRNAFARYVPAVDGGSSEVFSRAVAVLNAPSGARRDLLNLPITVLYDEIWQRHGDLRYRFDADRESGRLAYLRWLVEVGAAELGIPAIFLSQAQTAVDRARIRELEAGDSPPANAGPGASELPASADTVGGLIPAREADRDLIRRQQVDIRLLVGSNKGLRREALSLRVRRWRDEETIQALEQEFAQTRDAGEAAIRQSRELAAEVEAATRHRRELAAEIALLRSSFRLPFGGWLDRWLQSIQAEAAGRQVLAGDGPFFKRGFLLGETAAIVGTTVQRIKSAPSGTMIFGPYVSLPAGRYAVAIDARLYGRLPLLARFKVDVVCDGARQVVVQRRFRLYPFARWRRFELVFIVGDGQDYPDFEIRIWARKRTPLEIGRIDLYQLAEEPSAAAGAALSNTNGGRLS